MWAPLGMNGGFVCSAFRRNPAKEQRSGEKCWYLFIQESFVNNMYLGAFRNNITRPTELLNQFGSGAPAHTGAEVRDGGGRDAAGTARGKQPPTGARELTPNPGGAQGSQPFPGTPPKLCSTGVAPSLGAAQPRWSSGLMPG